MKNNTMSSLLLLLLIISFQFLLNLSHCGKIPAVIVFGDSTVDAGNNNQIPTLLKSNFFPYGRDFPGVGPTGRFCNGRLATDFISEGIGLGSTVPAYLDPAYDIRNFATGVCFASAGTGFDNATAGVLSVIPLWKEVEYFQDYRRRLRKYVGRAKARYIVREAVYIISIGTNDFLENYYLYVTGRFKQFTVAEFGDFLLGIAADFVTDIYRLGARKIIFTALSPIGCLPLERTMNLLQGGDCIEEYNDVAKDFNVKLQAMIQELCVALRGIKLIYNSPYDTMLDMITNPSRYGLDNVEEGCCGTGKFEMGYLCKDSGAEACADADKYMFWDSFHPTEKVNKILADLTLKTMAELL